MIRRDLHPICTACWDKVVGKPKHQVRNKHHFFTWTKHPACCWCGSPSHGQWWKMPRLQVPCIGFRGYHAEKSNVIDLTELREKYGDDSEVAGLIELAKGLQAELLEYERENN